MIIVKAKRGRRSKAPCISDECEW